MATTSPLVSRSPSYSCLCQAHLVAHPRPAMHHAVQHVLRQEATTMRRSISAPCLNKHSRFLVASDVSKEVDDAQMASTSARAGVAGASSVQTRDSHVQCEASAQAKPVAAESRFASLSRVLLVSQPSNMFRNLANRKWPSAVGPISLLVFLFGTLLAILAAVRGILIRKVKSCRSCKGFGVVRCRLCDGRGSVDWSAKFSYSEMCPLCAAKRFVVCPDCGGHYHRRLFSHAKAASGEQFSAGAANFNGVQVPMDR